MTKDELIKKHYSRLDKERKEMELKLKNMSLNQDHLERAIRMEEKPLRMALYKEQLEKDKAYFDEQQKKTLALLKEAHALNVARKAEFQAFPSFQAQFEAYRERLVSERESDLDALEESLHSKFESAKNARIDKTRLERKRKFYEAQVAKKAKEERDRVEAAKREEERRQMAERQARLDEIAAKQRAKEAELDAKEDARRREMRDREVYENRPMREIRPETTRRFDSVDSWRSTRAPPAAAATSAASSGGLQPSRMMNRSNSEMNGNASKADSVGVWRRNERPATESRSPTRPSSAMSNGKPSAGAYRPPGARGGESTAPSAFGSSSSRRRGEEGGEKSSTDNDGFTTVKSRTGSSNGSWRKA